MTAAYSIYNYGTRKYDYYRGHGDGATHAAPSRIRGQSDIGAIPEQAAVILPAGAVKIGSGDLPRGRIATRDAMGEYGVGDVPRYAIYALVAYLAWKVIR